MPIVPPIAVILAKDPRVFNYDLSSLTDMTCAAASLRQETAEEIAKRMKVNIRQSTYVTSLLANQDEAAGEIPLQHALIGQWLCTLYFSLYTTVNV